MLEHVCVCIGEQCPHPHHCTHFVCFPSCLVLAAPSPAGAVDVGTVLLGGTPRAPPAGGRSEALNLLWLCVWHLWAAWHIGHECDSRALWAEPCAVGPAVWFVWTPGRGARADSQTRGLLPPLPRAFPRCVCLPTGGHWAQRNGLSCLPLFTM